MDPITVYPTRTEALAVRTVMEATGSAPQVVVLRHGVGYYLRDAA